MLKIGLVTGEYPPMEGGVGAFTQELGKALAELGHEIHIISHRSARPTPEKKRVRDLFEPVDLGWATLHPLFRKWRWREMQDLTDIVVRQELDVVNIQYQASAFNMRNPAINYLPWRLRGVCKTVVTYHDLRTPYLFPKAGGLRRHVVRAMAKYADGVIVTNEADRQQIESENWRFNSLDTIAIGSNITVFPVSDEQVEGIREGLGLKTADKLLAYFGFLNRSKGAGDLLTALAHLPDNVNLVMIGGKLGASDSANNDAYAQELEAIIDTHNLAGRVHWTGFVEDALVSGYMKTADILVLPYTDGVSLRRGTLMAALAHGRPIVSTKVGSVPSELVHGENIWLVERNDLSEFPQQLAKEINQLVQDKATQTTLAQGARDIAEAFSWDKIALKTETFYRL